MKTTKEYKVDQIKADQKKLGELWDRYAEVAGVTGAIDERAATLHNEFYNFKEKMIRKYKGSYYEPRCKGNLKLAK